MINLRNEAQPTMTMKNIADVLWGKDLLREYYAMQYYIEVNEELTKAIKDSHQNAVTAQKALHLALQALQELKR